MKVEICVTEREGFVSTYRIKFNNGLVLRSIDCLWLSKDEHEKIKRDFVEVIQVLKSVGIEVVGEELVLDTTFNCTKKIVRLS